MFIEEDTGLELEEFRKGVLGGSSGEAELLVFLFYPTYSIASAYMDCIEVCKQPTI